MVKNPKIAVWRRRAGITCAVTGLLLLAAALFLYLRYASDLNNVHGQERAHYAPLLNRLWQASFYGSLAVGVASLFGLGWSRWVGLAASAGALFCTLLTLGAMCGPFGCQ